MGAQHGLTKHPLYKRWRKLKAKCQYKYQDGYELYGGRGVVMCQEWVNDFSEFFTWASDNGWSQEKIIVLKEGAMILGPEGCEVTTQKERQQRKSSIKQVEWCGKKYNLSELCKKLDKNYFTILNP